MVKAKSFLRPKHREYHPMIVPMTALLQSSSQTRNVFELTQVNPNLVPGAAGLVRIPSFTLHNVAFVLDGRLQLLC